MPVKVRCGGCEKVLNVPDKARGKTIACPECSEKIKVPAGDDAPPTKSGPSKAVKPKAKASKKDGEFLGGLDDYGIEDQENQICPFCAKPIDEEDDICPSCGKDLATGEMDKTEKKKRSKEGKSSAAFYKNVFGQSWQFMLENKGLALRTGGILTFFLILFSACLFMVLYCEKLPPKYFWVAMTILTGVGGPGWFWFLTRALVSIDLYGEKLDADRIHYDFFTNVALGLAIFLWPCVVNLPWLLPTVPTVYVNAAAELESKYPTPPEVKVDPKDAAKPAEKVEEVKPFRPSVFSMVSTSVYIGIGLGIMFLPVIAFPLATVHMVAKHQHKAWIGWDLIKLIFMNIGPICVYHSVFLGTSVVFGGIAFGVHRLLGNPLDLFDNEKLLGWTSSAVTWGWGLIDSQKLEEGSFLFVLMQMPLMFLLVALIVAPFMIALGFPLLYLMKINALIAKHFSHSLDLDQRIFPFTPAGFWVRFLAFWVDILMFPLAPLLVTRDIRFVMGGAALYGVLTLTSVYVFVMETMPITMVYILAPITALYMHWMYFSIAQSGTIRATLGMEAFGLIAMPDIPNPKPKDLDKVLTLGQASLRWVCNFFCSYVLLGLGFLVCAFHPEKKALHDLASKTKVVFEGDK
jgi:uncharacterized RDD family membrane protein YckC